MDYVYWGVMCRGKTDLRDMFLMNGKKVFSVLSAATVSKSYADGDLRVTSNIFTHDYDEDLITISKSRDLLHYKNKIDRNRYFNLDRTRKVETYEKRKPLLPCVEKVVDILNEYDPDLLIISDDSLVPYLDLKKAKHFIPYKSSLATHLKLVIDVGLEADPEKISVGDYDKMTRHMRYFDRSMKRFVDILNENGYDWEWFNLDDFDEYKKFGLEHTLNGCLYTNVERCFEEYAENERFLFVVDAAKKHVEEYKDKLYEIYPLMR